MNLFRKWRLAFNAAWLYVRVCRSLYPHWRGIGITNGVKNFYFNEAAPILSNGKHFAGLARTCATDITVSLTSNGNISIRLKGGPLDDVNGQEIIMDHTKARAFISLIETRIKEWCLGEEGRELAKAINRSRLS